jgi:hypothetical protein
VLAPTKSEIHTYDLNQIPLYRALGWEESQTYRNLITCPRGRSNVTKLLEDF